MFFVHEERNPEIESTVYNVSSQEQICLSIQERAFTKNQWDCPQIRSVNQDTTEKLQV